MEKNSSKLKKRITAALFALLVAFAAMGASTFAWYIYNTSAHTTKLQMAAGSFYNLLISDAYDGEYKYTVALDSVVGELTPVSTNSMLGGFQIVSDTREGGAGEPSIVAYLFRDAEKVCYFVRPLYLKASGDNINVYVKNIGFQDSSATNPISTAIRVGLVVYQAGDPNTPEAEYIFDINPDQHIQTPTYNTATGKEGYVLDASAADSSGKKLYGVTVPFTPLTSNNFCEVDSTTGETTLKTNSTRIATCPGSEGQEGSPVRVDVYIWLEGCDSDCYGTLGNLSDLSFEFAGFTD